MIYFITTNAKEYRASINTSLFDNITILDDIDGLDLFYRKLKGKREVYLDVEASSLDAYRADLLLTGVKVKSDHFMFDYTIDTFTIVDAIVDKYVVGHNLKYDIKILKVNSGILIKRLYDTMIAEQRLFMGAGYSFGYDELVSRYTGKVLLKTTRNEFIDAKAESFTIQPHHLMYLKGDLDHLKTIKEKQKVLIHKRKMQFLIYGIENALVPVLANAELRGFNLDIEKWLERIIQEQEEKYNILCNLDNIVKELRDTLPDAKREYLVGGKWDKVRKRNTLFDIVNTNGTVQVKDLFGNDVTSSKDLFGNKKKIIEYPGCVSYTKSEVIHIFGALGVPAITEVETFSVPRFHNGKISNINDYSIKEGILVRYAILRPNSVISSFLEAFGQLQKVNKSLSTYGKSFIDKVNEITGKIHTSFGQCFTETGRMSSGGGKNEPDKYNAQNLPRNLSIRQAFTADKGKLINTADYSGAELIVMASHAQDFRLLELSKGDMHSHFATQGWRTIYKAKAAEAQKIVVHGHLGEEEREKYMTSYKEYLDLASNFTVTKDNPPGYRTAYKPIAFGIVYGAYAKKVSQILNIAVNEGQLVINSVKREIPKTITMVENNSKFAENNGYLVHNSRTNSRRWFPALIKQIKGEYNKTDHFKEISADLSAARNSGIQGTQADFVKEASVKLQYYYWKNNIDANILSWIHDEIVDEAPEDIAEELSLIKHKILTETANLYLKNVTIDVEMSVLPYWTK